MRAAIREARKSLRRGQTPFGACIVKNGILLASAHNTVWRDTDITAHAEIQAIRRACKKLGTVRLTGCVIYSTCEPCPMCFAACHWADLSAIYYGAGIADAKKLGFRELLISNTKMKRLGSSFVKIKGRVLKAENLKLFQSWSAKKNKKTY
jgi:tRNA(Arg) A34 adenosine deaminase TadA